jgi:protein-tyrosine-phosphatase
VSYRSGLRCRWISGDIRRIVSIFAEPANDGFPRPSKWSESIRFLADFAAPTCPAIWSWRDPLAALAELKGTLESVAGGFLRRIKGKIKRTLAAYRYLGWRNTIAYLRLRALHAIRLKRDLPPRNLTGIHSILFVCHGNIIRSPMAEALLRKYLAGFDVEISVSSAGFIEEPERRADERARILAKEFGVSLNDHRPRALTPELIKGTGVIFIMDYLNEARMRVRYPLAKSKTFYLGAYTADHKRHSVEIPDPNLATLADMRRCYQTIDAHVQKLFNALTGGVEDLMLQEKRSLFESVAD